MTRYGYFLSCEEYPPADLVRQAPLAEQGEAAFAWTVIGAIAQATSLPITTAVTCPLVRIHPAVIAQAAATCALLTGGRFILGVGSGEALNEHIPGDHW